MVQPRVSLTQQQRDWLLMKWNRLRDKQLAADKASAAWEDRSATLKQYCKDNSYNAMQTRSKTQNDPYLQDHMAAWSWNAREAERISADISAFYQMLQMGMFDAQ